MFKVSIRMVKPGQEGKLREWLPELMNRKDEVHETFKQETDVPASVTFVNSTTKRAAYYWLDYEGKAIFYGWLEPGNSDQMNSFVGHPWCFVDIDNGKALQADIVTAPEQTFIIR